MIEPSTVLIQIADTAASKIVAAFTEFAARKYRNYRMENFLNQLCEQLESVNSEDVDELLNSLQNNDELTDSIQEAIRASCHGKSKTHCPKVGAIIIAQAMNDRRILTPMEESIIAILSELYDSDIEALKDFLDRHPKQVKSPLAEHITEEDGRHPPAYRDTLEINDEIDLSAGGRENSYFDAANLIGRWAVVFNNYGLLKIQQNDEFQYYDGQVTKSTSLRISIPKEVRDLQGHLGIVCPRKITPD